MEDINIIDNKKLIGLERYFNDLVKLINSNSLPKVLMLTGKKGIGKFTLVHHLLAYNHDRKNYDQSNYTIMEKSLFLTTPKKNLYNNINYYSGEDKSVKIENIRNLRLNLQKTTIDNKVRFIILDDVEKFNLNCLNALLKTIEEPSVFNHFILINNNKSNILETIRSRSIEFKIFLSTSTINKIIKNIIDLNNIDCKIDFNKTRITPGDFLKFNNICLENDIDFDKNIIFNIRKLFNLYKNKKNYDYLDFCIFLVNKHFFEKFKNNKFNDLIISDRSLIVNKINFMKSLNLNTLNTLSDIEEILK